MSLGSSGADLEALDHRGETPLFAAIRGGKWESFLLLCDAGASLHVQNHRKQDPRQLARRSRKRGIEPIRRWLEQQSP